MESIGNILKKRREALGLSQHHIAIGLGISQSGYVLIEQGKTKLSFERAILLTHLLGISLNEMVKNEISFSTSQTKDIHLPKENMLKNDIQKIQKEIITISIEINLLKKIISNLFSRYT